MTKAANKKETKELQRSDRAQRVDTLVKSVREDAQKDTAQYLKDTVVPAGGE